MPNESSNTISVVRAGKRSRPPDADRQRIERAELAAFDGQRVLVTNLLGDSVSLWKAADLTPLGFFPTGTNTKPPGACSDGIDFWITLMTVNQIARF